MDEFRLGILIGLALSFRNLLNKLPDGKPAFLFNILALNYMFGGYQYGKTKMIAAFLVNVFCRSFELLIDKFWEHFGDAIWENVSAFLGWDQGDDGKGGGREAAAKVAAARQQQNGWLDDLAGRFRL